MPHFIYNVVPVRAKEDYRQAGPTCWYYAAKMLLRFHDRILPQAEAEYRAWKGLHVIRQLITLDNFTGSTAQLPLVYGPALEKRLKTLQSMEQQPGSKKSDGLSTRDKKLLPFIPEAIAILQRYNNALQVMGSVADMRRYGLFQAAFGTPSSSPCRSASTRCPSRASRTRW